MVRNIGIAEVKIPSQPKIRPPVSENKNNVFIHLFNDF